MKSILFVSACVAVLGCTGEISDSSMYLTGTEEYALQLEDGSYACENPKKVLICHIPPGNPDNAHTICVSEHAVAPHQTHHGDPVGPCDGDGGGDDDSSGEPDAGGDDGLPDATPEHADAGDPTDVD